MSVSKSRELNSKKTLRELFSIIGGYKQLGTELNKTADSADNASNSLGKLSSAASIYSIKTLTKSVSKLFSTFSKYSQKAVDYIEDLNLLKVAFGDTSDAAYGLAKSIADVTGFDEATLVRNLATFRNLTSTLGLANEQADLLATNLEKMSLDISSLYNVDVDRAAYALQGMLTGQPRTIKTLTGANVTNAAMQEELNSRGIGLKVTELNKAEKAILQYITVEKQLMNANGDMARTLEQPAQLLRVFREQVSKAARSIGSLLIPVIKTVIPYLTAFLMVFNEVVAIILRFFHIDADNFWKSMNYDLGKTVKSLNGVTKASKAAQKGLRNFDRLNVINTPTSGDTGAGGIGGINSQLLGLLDEYDLKLNDIQTKATKIRDTIMEWLGFGKDANGEWHFVGITFGTILATLVGAGGIIWAISKVFNLFKKAKGIFSILGGVGKVKDLKETSSSFKVPDVKTVLKGLADLALIVGGVVLLVEAIGLFMKIKGAKETLVTGIEVLVETFTGLAKIILPLAVFSAGIVGLGLAGVGTVVNGMLGMATIMGGLEVLMLAIGAIAKIPYVQEFVSTGIDVMVKVFEGLGKMGGAIIAGFTDMATAGLPAMGQHLAEFMANIQPFFELSKGIDETHTKAIKYLSQAILTLTAADILNGILGWVSGGSSLLKFGEELVQFAPYMKAYSESIKGLNSKVVEASSKAAQSLAEFAKKLPRSGGVWGFLAGNRDMDAFVATLPSLGKNLKKYSDNVSGIKNDVVESSAKSAEALAELANKLPRDGGVWGLLAGNKDMEKFAKALPDFGTNLKKYSTNVSGIDSDVVSNSAKAAQSVAELAKMIPNEGGLVALFTGDNSIKKFGEELKSFGESFKSYYNSISNLSTDKINIVTESLSKLVDAAILIKDKGVKSTLKEFASELKKSSGDFEKFFSVKSAKDIGNDFGTQIGNSIVAALKKITYPKINLLGTDNKTVIGSYKIQAKAEGGFVDSGELYMARENGMSEYIGRVGHKTAVANNDQIVDAVSQGVANAIISTGGLNNRPVVIKAEGDANGLMSFIKLKQQEDDMQYGY